MKNSESILEALRNLREALQVNGKSDSAEAIRICIIQVANELNEPTGLSVADLVYGLESNPGEVEYQTRPFDPIKASQQAI